MGRYGCLKDLNLPWEKLKNAKVLITGGNGLIASGIVDALVELSELKNLETEVYVLCRNEEKAQKRFGDLASNHLFHLIIQDVVEPLKCEERFDYIVHAASAAHPEAFNNVPVDVMRANFIGTMNMLEYAKKTPDTRFMFVSSSEVYGENETGVAEFTEEAHGDINFTRFRACYPESKRASETLCFCYAKQYGSDVVIVRPAFIYGKDINETNNRADVYFLRQALEHKDIVMYSEGSQVRSYCYITDCVSGVLFALLKGASGAVYNIGNKKCIVTMKEYAQQMADMGGVRLLFEIKEKPAETVFLKTTRCVLNTDKLERLGWKPMFDLKSGLKDIFDEKRR